MGNFITNIQIYNNKNKINFDLNIKESIIKYLGKNEFKLISNEEEIFSKKVYIIKHPNEDWFSLYDEDFDEQDKLYLKKTANFISKELKSNCFTVSVNDSDSFNFCLHENGKKIEEIIITSSKKKNSEINLTNLDKLDLSKKEINNINSVLKQDLLFAEEYLFQIATILNLQASIVSNNLNEIDNDEKINPIILTFKSTSNDTETKTTPFLTQKFGAILNEVTNSPLIQNRKEFQPSLFLTNTGRPITNLKIMLKGEAIDENYFIPIKLEYVQQKNKNFESQQRSTHTFLKSQNTNNIKETLFYVDLDKLDIPQGFEINSNSSSKNFITYFEKATLFSCILIFEFEYLKKGESSFEIFVIANENTEIGYFYSGQIIYNVFHL